MLKKIFVVFILSMLFLINASASDGDEYIVKLKSADVPELLYSRLVQLGEGQNLYVTDSDTADKYKNYFEYINKNEIVDITGIETPQQEAVSLFATSYFSAQYDYINAEYAWDLTTYGNEVNVAVIDTGCNSHSDFGGNLKGGYDYVNSSDDFSDENGHGTHVSGIIAAALGNTVTGVAPKVNLYALKCIDPDKGTTISMFANAIYDAVDVYNCKVINMSLGFDHYDDIYDAIKYAYDKGVIIVAAVGNDGTTESEAYNVYYPSGYDEVIGVGSVCYDGSAFVRSDFSQKNSKVMVAAPGELVKSLNGTSAYAYMSGTSQAAPMVAAGAAILLSARSDMTPDEFMEYIENCSQSLTDDYCGYGLLDIEAMFDECIKDIEWYVSPVDTDGITVYNNTDETATATAVLVGTDGGEYVRIGTADVELDAKSKICLKSADMEVEKLFLWQSLKNLMPLAKPKTAAQ